MKHTKQKLAGLALATSLILATAASAKIPVGEYVEISGYAGASARYDKVDRDHGEADFDTAKLDLDAVKLSADIKYNAVSARVSAYVPGESLDSANRDDIFITEAYVAYAFGNGFTVSGGRFQSWIGYEPFNLDQQWTLTHGIGPMSYLVPNFHDGVRVEYTAGKITLGVAVVDSIYNDESVALQHPSDYYLYYGDAHPYSGDTNVRNGLGAEFSIRYSDETFSMGATLALESNSDTSTYAQGAFDYDLYVFDLWAQYYLASTKTTIGVEFISRNTSWKESSLVSQYYNAVDVSEYAALLSARQRVTDRLSVAGSVSLGQKDGSTFAPEDNVSLRYVKVAVAPSFVLTENLEVRAEASWTKYSKDSQSQFDYVGDPTFRRKEGFFGGVQVVFKF
ncbi:MAG: porin [Opitutaceae bacterium]|nr:porin [Opitutaceae bacterium]